VNADGGVSSSAQADAPDFPTWRSVLAGPLVAIATVAAALLATNAADVPFKDPDHVVGKRLAMVGGLILLLVILDVVVRAGRRARTFRPSRAAIRSVQRERWTRRRGIAVASALVSFYVTYLAYRNLKSIVPLLRPGDNFDRQLGDLERGFFGGHDPAALLHSLLGTGVAAEVLSVIYVVFIFFLPVSLALALVFSPDLPGGIFYATALSINWGLGAASYFMLPSMGPVFAAPAGFAELPATEASRLQGLMLDQRADFLRDPAAADAAQNIAAFASLHISMIFTAALAAHMLGLGRRLRIGLWVLFSLSAISTIYLGWHYVVDDLAGLLIALTALALAYALTGFRPRSERRLRLPKLRPLGSVPVGAAATRPRTAGGRRDR
jgi:membrane-associated phospholipid phosphatase